MVTNDNGTEFRKDFMAYTKICTTQHRTDMQKQNKQPKQPKGKNVITYTRGETTQNNRNEGVINEKSEGAKKDQ